MLLSRIEKGGKKNGSVGDGNSKNRLCGQTE
jgi:hypothetical protein